MRIERLEIADGNKGVMETVEHMRALALAGSQDPHVITWAESIAGASCCPSAVIQEIRLFLMARVRFVFDPLGVELIRDPLYMLRQIERLGYTEGDCDDSATFGAALGLANMIPARFRLLSLSPSLVFSHVFVELWGGLEGWMELDITAPAQTPPGLKVWKETTVEV